MRYLYYLILSIICLLNMAPVLAQDTRYRVELLVLTHLNHDQQPRELKHLQDYSPATDFLTPPEPEEEAEEQEEETDRGGNDRCGRGRGREEDRATSVRRRLAGCTEESDLRRPREVCQDRGAVRRW